ncbi:methionyl-tRNA formyltransferase [Desulfuribacillus alkaliarsenatis]|uniref:Methionyl-tRNA formyltransferase n=1 Tax=Desulfuribacillus alkaliarsenatis TaxID=766136 RepID=A0A1E5G710_9FIRM|nr:methionyl-tRNA formyltransferase [Desulfuribacillus alkaliarsenatis]OEF98534.1 methionyl-tRNA formyltransferase [Desulfuribacillus alkaliarsenatis]
MRILFMGTPDFAVPCLEALIEHNYNVIGVVTQPDRPKGRKQVLTPPPVKVVAEKYNLPVFQPEKISNNDETDKFKDMQIDLVITAAFGQLLSKEFLAIPRLGCINVHASLLPKYRGGAPIHWAVINGETETGVTIMYMVEKLDAGPMISQKTVQIADTDTTGIVYDKVTKAGATLLIETLPELINGRCSPVEQDHRQATFAYNIRREDEIIDWRRPAKEIYNQVRGLAPWPGAYTTLEGQIIKVWSSEEFNDNINNSYDRVGTVVKVVKEGPIISTGNGLLLIKEIQPAGKKLMPATNYVNNGKLLQGTSLGT